MTAIRLENECLFVSGELNFETVMRVLSESLPLLAQCKQWQFNFSEVSEANSAAIALMLEWLKYAKQQGKPISFGQLPLQLNSIATVLGVSTII